MTSAGLASEKASENKLCVRWIVFASGQRLREEYGTTASAGVNAALEEEVRTLCREFHTAIGVQEVPTEPPVLLFWKARQAQDWIITQVSSAPRQAGHRVAYEYFSLVFAEAELLQLGDNPLRALEPHLHEALRQQFKAGSRAPLTVSPALLEAGEGCSTPFGPRPAPALLEQFSRGGILPATRGNREALLAYLDSAFTEFAEDEATQPPTFATWWPSGQPPRIAGFSIVLQSTPPPALKPHEVAATALALNHALKQALAHPPGTDGLAGAGYHSLLVGADEVHTLIDHAYLPVVLEESPTRWTAHPQQAAALCQRLANDLQSYAQRLPQPANAEVMPRLNDLAKRYLDFARELQKLKHPNLMRTSRDAGRGAGLVETRTADEYRLGLSAANGANRHFNPAVLLAGLVALCVIVCGVLGVRTFLDASSSRARQQEKVGRPTAGPDPVGPLPTKDTEHDREQRAIAQMHKRADLEVTRVARNLAEKRVQTVDGLNQTKIERTVMDAVAQAMTQTPHAKIDDLQKGILLQLATDEIRAKALAGVNEGVRQRVQSLRAARATRERQRQRARERAQATARRRQMRRRRQQRARAQAPPGPAPVAPPPPVE